MNDLEIQREQSHKLDPKLFEGHGITFETFNASDQSLCADPLVHPFFLPAELKTLEAFKPDLSLEWVMDLIENRLRDWYVPEEQVYPDVNYHNAGELCVSLHIAFSGLPYKKENGKWKFPSDSYTWKKIIYGPRGFDATNCWRDEWRSQPQDVWAATDKPHMMASMGHYYAHEDDLFFVSEIEVIVGLMIIRLVNRSFPDHNVVPVMLFSFTGNKRGRILQAHMNDKGLVIRKSEFYDFSPRKDTHMSLFVQYMMSSLQGVTQTLNRPEILSSIAEESYTIEHLEASGDIRSG